MSEEGKQELKVLSDDSSSVKSEPIQIQCYNKLSPPYNTISPVKVAPTYSVNGLDSTYIVESPASTYTFDKMEIPSTYVVKSPISDYDNAGQTSDYNAARACHDAAVMDDTWYRTKDVLPKYIRESYNELENEVEMQEDMVSQESITIDPTVQNPETPGPSSTNNQTEPSPTYVVESPVESYDHIPGCESSIQSSPKSKTPAPSCTNSQMPSSGKDKATRSVIKYSNSDAKRSFSSLVKDRLKVSYLLIDPILLKYLV